MKHVILFAILLLFFSCTDKTPQDHFNKGIKHYNEGVYSSALKSFWKCVDLDSNYQNVTLYIAQCHFDLRDYKQSLLEISEILESDKNDFKAYLLRAKIKYRKEDIVGALNDCDIAESINSDYHPIYLFKSKIFESLNDFDNSVIELERVKELGQINGQLLYNLGRLYFRLGNDPKAYEYLTLAGEDGVMESYDIIKTLNVEKAIMKPEIKNVNYYKSKDYQVFTEFNLAIKVDCQLEDISSKSNEDHDFNYACEDYSTFHQVIINRLPLGYKDYSEAKKRDFEAQMLKEFGNNYVTTEFGGIEVQAVTNRFNKLGSSGRGMAFIANNCIYAFVVIRESGDPDYSFNKFTNSIEYVPD